MEVHGIGLDIKRPVDNPQYGDADPSTVGLEASRAASQQVDRQGEQPTATGPIDWSYGSGLGSAEKQCPRFRSRCLAAPSASRSAHTGANRMAAETVIRVNDEKGFGIVIRRADLRTANSN
jgi:hypothetical protein